MAVSLSFGAVSRLHLGCRRFELEALVAPVMVAPHGSNDACAPTPPGGRGESQTDESVFHQGTRMPHYSIACRSTSHVECESHLGCVTNERFLNLSLACLTFLQLLADATRLFKTMFERHCQNMTKALATARLKWNRTRPGTQPPCPGIGAVDRSTALEPQRRTPP